MKKKALLNSRTGRAGVGFTFIDLFAGMGGFHKALHDLGAECVFASERDPAARLTYKHNFADSALFADGDGRFNSDITEITQIATSRSGSVPKSLDVEKSVRERIRREIRQFDVLCAGFPCQPFSQVGHGRGFDDERGNLFFDIESILRARRPPAIFLENVRNILGHDHGNTITQIRNRLKEAGYGSVWTPVVWASEHGCPQHRPRVFIIGFRNRIAREYFSNNLPKPVELFNTHIPDPPPLRFTMSDVFGGTVRRSPRGGRRDIGFTLRVGGRGSPIVDRRNWDGYWVDGKERRLTPRHGLMMQGFTESLESDEFGFPESVNDVQAMRLLGNSVAVPAVRSYAAVIFEALRAARG